MASSMTFTLSNLFEVIAALGLINVWLFRSNLATPFRGGTAKNLKAEFRAYGLSDTVFKLVGALKLGCAAALIAGLWFPALTLPAASVLVGLMLGAISMHIKVKDPLVKSLPALVMLAMSLWITLASR